MTNKRDRPYNGFTLDERHAGAEFIRAERRKGRAPLGSRGGYPCDGCGTRHSTAGHSEDYGGPFGHHCGAFRFCVRCHGAIHGRFKRPDRWTLYLDAIQEGKRWPPLRNFGAFRAWWASPTGQAFLADADRINLFGDVPAGPKGRTELHLIESGVYERDAARRRACVLNGADPGPGMLPVAHKLRLLEWKERDAAS